MGPYPHDAPPPAISPLNPMGTDGFEFVEFATDDPAHLGDLFEQMGFACVAQHRSKNVLLYRQGDVSFIINAEPDGFGRRFAQAHGPSVCAFAFRVADAQHAVTRAQELGATAVKSAIGPMELEIPAIEGIGGALIYLVDRYGEQGSIYDVDFVWKTDVERRPVGHGLHYIDHLTHNVFRGKMDAWSAFYERYFNFKEIRYFDIEGKLTGLYSRAMTSPCGKIRIPINESADDASQIEEYLRAYNGEGVQHIACGSRDIYASVAGMRRSGVAFMPEPPPTYYEGLEKRLPGHAEDASRLQQHGILIDGAPTENGGTLLQIFTSTLVGPVFFELIQRKGDEGFGEGNFKALFESIEQDQIRRGVLTPT